MMLEPTHGHIVIAHLLAYDELLAPLHRGVLVLQLELHHLQLYGGMLGVSIMDSEITKSAILMFKYMGRCIGPLICGLNSISFFCFPPYYSFPFSCCRRRKQILYK